MKLFEEFCQDPEINVTRIDAEERDVTCHFICKNTVEAIVMQRDHPIEPLELISTHFTFDDWRMVVRMAMYFEKKDNSQLGDDSKP